MALDAPDSKLEWFSLLEIHVFLQLSGVGLFGSEESLSPP